MIHMVAQPTGGTRRQPQLVRLFRVLVQYALIQAEKVDGKRQLLASARNAGATNRRNWSRGSPPVWHDRQQDMRRMFGGAVDLLPRHPNGRAGTESLAGI